MPKLRTLGRLLTRAERYERMEAAIDRFGLSKVRKNFAARLSGGEKRRLEIARCLVCEPTLILLDEPFTGIDPITIAEIRQIILELRNEGIGILLTDHNVHEALKITTSSYLIKDGKVRTHGSPAQIVRDPIAIAEYLGAGFSDNNYRAPEDARPPLPAPPAQVVQAPTPAPPPAATKTLEFPGPAPKASAAQMILEQEKIQRLVENLKTAEQASAAEELAKKGPAAIPALLACWNAATRSCGNMRSRCCRRSPSIRSRSTPSPQNRPANNNWPLCAICSSARRDTDGTGYPSLRKSWSWIARPMRKRRFSSVYGRFTLISLVLRCFRQDARRQIHLILRP